MQKFPNQIGQVQSQASVSRITNLGGCLRRRIWIVLGSLPLSRLMMNLSLFPQDVKCPPTKAKAKRDSKPLARGYSQESQKGLRVQALSDWLRFNHPGQLDTGIDKLLPAKKTSHSIQGVLSDNSLRHLERALSSLSYALWSMNFATKSLTEISEEFDEIEFFCPITSACKQSLSFLFWINSG